MKVKEVELPKKWKGVMAGDVSPVAMFGQQTIGNNGFWSSNHWYQWFYNRGSRYVLTINFYVESGQKLFAIGPTLER